MKSIDTLIEDIQAIFDENIETPAITDSWCDELGHSIGTMLRDRLQEERTGGSLRLSGMGHGIRKQWYNMRPDTPQEKLSPDTRMKFLYGDVLELILIALAKLAGHSVTNEQETVEVEAIKGHIDCLIDGELIDVKSASTFSFNKFKKEEVQLDDPFGYYMQLGAYGYAMNKRPYGWLVFDKTLGHMCLSKALDAYIPDVTERIERVKASVAQDVEPAPCAYPVADGKSGNMKLPTVCSYCQYKRHCWRDANGGYGLRVFLYSTGARYLTNVAVLPKVQEITNENIEG